MLGNQVNPDASLRLLQSVILSPLWRAKDLRLTTACAYPETLRTFPLVILSEAKNLRPAAASAYLSCFAQHGTHAFSSFSIR